MASDGFIVEWIGLLTLQGARKYAYFVRTVNFGEF